MGPYVQSMRARIGNDCLFLPGVRAIIVNDRGEALLQRRTDMDCWGLPAGAIEIGETVLEALRREVLEETGLVVLHAEPMALYSGPNQRFRYPNGDEVQGLSVAFIVRDWTGEPKADGVEGSTVRFWPVTALPSDIVPFHARTLADFTRHPGRFVVAED